MEPTKEKGVNINFDSRVGRAQILTDLLRQITLAQAQDDYYMWYKALRGLYYMCSPYVKETEAKEVKDKLVASELWIGKINDRRFDGRILLKKLDDATELSLMTFRDQFMITKTDESTEFSEDDFLGLKGGTT